VWLGTASGMGGMLVLGLVGFSVIITVKMCLCQGMHRERESTDVASAPWFHLSHF